MSRLLHRVPFFLLMVLLLVACRRQQEPTPIPTPVAQLTATAVPVPTVTAVPPTPTPEPLVLDLTSTDPLLPRVIGRAPDVGQEVGLDGRIELYFDQPMDRTKTAAALQIASADGQIITGEITWPAPRILRFEPTVPLAPASQVEVRLAETAASESGLTLAEGLTFSLDTLGSLQVVQVSPPNGTADVQTDTAVTVIFNRPVVPLLMSEQQADLPNPLLFDPPVEGTGEWVNTSVYVFRPTTGFLGRSSYTVRLVVDDINAVSATGATLADDYTWSFSIVPPTIWGLTLPNVTDYPSNDFTHLRLNQDFQVRFNQPMNIATTEPAITMASDAGQVPLQFTWNEEQTTAVFTPTQLLDLSTRYVLSVADTATSAAGGRLREGLVWNATTALTPAIFKTTPTDGDIADEFSSVFTIQFTSRMDRDTLKGKVIISPEIAGDADGQYSSGEWALRFFGFEPSTTYTIRILPGMADPYGNEITEERVVTFTTAAYTPSASLQLQNPFALYRLGGSTAMWVRYRNVRQLDMTLYRTDAAAFIPIVGAGYYYYGSDSGSTAVIGSSAEVVWRQSAAVQADQNTIGYQRFDLLNQDGSPLPPGYYYTSVSSPDIPSEFPSVDNRLMVLANANVTLKTTSNEAMIWVTDLATGAPLPNIPVRLTTAEGDLVTSGTTNDDGLFYKDDLELSTNYDAIYLATAEGQGIFGVTSNNWSEGTEPYDFGIYSDFYLRPGERNTYLYTERSIYRPGQAVEFKGIIRANDDLHYTIPDLSTVTVRINSYEGLVYEETLPVNEFGSFVGSLQLADEATLGGYYMDVQVDSTGEYIGYGNFNVAEYRKPTYQVLVNPTPENIALGQTVNAAVQADFYAGGSVANGDVYWVVRSTPFSFYPGGNLSPYSFNSVGRDYGYGYDGGYDYEYYNQFISEGTGQTDGRGQFNISVPAAPSEKQPGSRTFEIEATVNDIAGNAVSGRTSVVVHQSSYYPGIKTSQRLGTVGEELTYDLIVVDWEAQPVPNRTVSVQVVERRWNSVQEEDEFGNTIWKSEVEEIPAAEFEDVATDGNGRASVSFTPTKPGVYRAYVTAADERGNSTTSTTYTWVAGDEFVPWRRSNDHGFDLIADADSYKPGDTAEILIASPFQGTSYALVTLERGHIYQREVITLESNSTIYRLPITGDMAPNMFVSILVMKGVDEFNSYPDFKLGMVQFNVERETQALNVVVTPDRTTLGPRDTVNYTVRVTDSNGRPVQAELSAALIDLAVYNLAAPTVPPLLDFFYSNRWLSVRTALLLTKNMDGYNAELQAQIKGGGGGGGDGGVLTIRENFKDTAYWGAQLTTDADGVATFSVELPDNLTTWRLDVKAVTADTRVGEALNDVQTTRPLLVSPQTPRFFIQGDRAIVGTVVRNTTNQSMDAAVTMQVTGAETADTLTQNVTVPANDSAYVTWEITVQDVERVDLLFSANSGEFSDAARPEIATLEGGGLPVYRYEVMETVGTSGQLLDGGSIVESLGLPIFPNFTFTEGDIEVEVASSLAAAMTDALDYLEHYPYECTEQIVSKFLPNVLTTHALQTAGVSDPALEAQLTAQVNIALQRLASRQNTDGGWPWWTDYTSDTLVTAYVLQGLYEAQQAGYSVDPTLIVRGRDYLANQIFEVDGLNGRFKFNRQAYLLYVLTQVYPEGGWEGNLDTLYGQRETLDLYARALLAQALYNLDPADPRLKTLTSDFVTTAALSATGTSWSEENRDYWNWNSDTRSTAIILSYLSAVDPENPLVANSVRWLMSHREAGGYWGGTQETAWTIMALTDWMERTDELQADYQYEIAFNGNLLAQASATAETLRTPLQLTIGLDEMQTDVLNRLAIGRTDGPGNLYYTAHLNASLPVEQVQALDKGIIISRNYYQADDLNTPVESAAVGETLVAKLTIVVPDDLHYVVIDDYLPAGLEGVDQSLRTSQQVGAPDPYTLNEAGFGSRGWGWWYFSHVELRDERVVISARYLPAGTYEYLYLVRASTVGEFRTIPVTAFEFYFPEVYGRGDGMLFTVTPAN